MYKIKNITFVFCEDFGNPLLFIDSRSTKDNYYEIIYN